MMLFKGIMALLFFPLFWLGASIRNEILWLKEKKTRKKEEAMDGKITFEKLG